MINLQLRFNIDFFAHDTYLEVTTNEKVWLGNYAILDLPMKDENDGSGLHKVFIQMPNMFLHPYQSLRISTGDGDGNPDKSSDNKLIEIYLGLDNFCWNTKSAWRTRLIKFKMVEESD